MKNLAHLVRIQEKLWINPAHIVKIQMEEKKELEFHIILAAHVLPQKVDGEYA